MPQPGAYSSSSTSRSGEGRWSWRLRLSVLLLVLASATTCAQFLPGEDDDAGVNPLDPFGPSPSHLPPSPPAAAVDPPVAPPLKANEDEQQGYPDLMQDGCFAGPEAAPRNLSDYNEYGFRKVPAGSRLGAWWIAAGDVDEYYAPAVQASAAAHGSSGAGGAGSATNPDANGTDGDQDSWLLPPNVSPGCDVVLDVNGEKPCTIIQTFTTTPDAKYRLSFSFAGDILPHNLGPPPHSAPTFKSMSVYWNGQKVGDIYINSLEKENVGMDWDRAEYLLEATSASSTLAIMSTTKGRSGLAVTDFKLLDVSAAPVPPAHKPPSPFNPVPGGGGAGEAPGRRRSGAGVFVVVLSLGLLLLLAAVMTVGTRIMMQGGGAPGPLASAYWFLPNWRQTEEGYGVLGSSSSSGGGGAYQNPFSSSSSSSYQSGAGGSNGHHYHYQGATDPAAAAASSASWVRASPTVARHGVELPRVGKEWYEGDEEDEEEEVMYQRGRGRSGGDGESKRDGPDARNGSMASSLPQQPRGGRGESKVGGNGRSQGGGRSKDVV